METQVRTTAEYMVPQSPNEVASRLAGSMNPKRWSSEMTTEAGDHYGSVNGNTFEIKVATGHHNSFKPILFGRIDSCPGGSRVRVQIGRHRFTSVFLILWLSATVGFQVLFALGLFFENPQIKGWAVFAPTVMALFGLALYRFGKMLGRPEEQRLLTFADQLWGPPVSTKPPGLSTGPADKE